MGYVCELIDKLASNSYLNEDEYLIILNEFSNDDRLYAKKVAKEITSIVFDNKIYLRGLIEFSNFCKNDCLYCGLRRSNRKVCRYRLSKKDILKCCEYGYSLGLRTFVLQGGEDAFFDVDVMCDIVENIRKEFDDCAITLSIGERSYEDYKAFFDAGADRYLLRHETACKLHYEKLHPSDMSFDNRMRCLDDLKSIGFQVGCGFMVGSPYQTNECLAKDLTFIQKFKPHMVGIGPFIPNKDTPFRDYCSGDEKMTIMLISLLRIMLKNVLLPATTALGSLKKDYRFEALDSGANVIMPNISPASEKEKYMLYDNKICTSEDASKYIKDFDNNVKKYGYTVVSSRGDYKTIL